MSSCTIRPDSVTLSCGNYEAEILPFGALLNRYALRRRNGEWHNAVAAYASPQDARLNITELFRSAKLSPFACRIADSRYTFSGCLHRLGKFAIGTSAIHGLLFDAPFSVEGSQTDADGTQVLLAYAYRGSEAGYPFPYRIRVCYRLHGDGRLSLETTVQNTGDAAMPLVDGWHPYFAADGNPADWTLTVRSGTRLAFDDNLLPTGEQVADSRFLGGARLADTALDDCFVLDSDFRLPAAVLQGEHIRLSITPDASYPFMQVYTPPDRRSIALENLSGAPDAFNNGIGLVVLEPQQEYLFRTVYHVEEV